MVVDAAIEEYSILRDPPDALRSVVEMAAFVADVPMATINVLTSTTQHQTSVVGFDAGICDREDSMCGRTVELGRPIVVSDASHDERFRDNPFVNGEIGEVRFYASFPLRMRGAIVIGTLCVFDSRPREIDADQEQSLATLADRIVDVLELGRRTRELTQALEESSRLRDELRTSNERLSSFAGSVSHDLAGPLSTVTLALGQLEDELETPGSPPAAMSRWVATGLRGADRMSSMIAEYLAFARLGGDLQLRPVGVEEVVVEACLDLGLDPEAGPVRRTPLPRVMADPRHLRAVLQNLLSNAVKFSVEEPSIEISARQVGSCWRVEVADRGIGITEEDADRVFEPLARVDQEVEGTGIGLSTSRLIIQGLGGRIGIEPRAGGGAVAWFELPTAAD